MSHNHPTYFDVAKKKLLQRANALSVNRWINAFRGKPMTLCEGLSWEATGEATGQDGASDQEPRSTQPEKANKLRICWLASGANKSRKFRQISREGSVERHKSLGTVANSSPGARSSAMATESARWCPLHVLIVHSYSLLGTGWCYQNIDDPKPLLNLTRQLFCKPSTCQIQVMTVGAYLRRVERKPASNFDG